MDNNFYELGQQLALEEFTKVAGLGVTLANVGSGALSSAGKGAILGTLLGGIQGGLSDDSTFQQGAKKGFLVGGSIGLGAGAGNKILRNLVARAQGRDVLDELILSDVIRGGAKLLGEKRLARNISDLARETESFRLPRWAGRAGLLSGAAIGGLRGYEFTRDD
jgi:hypothetical protein